MKHSRDSFEVFCHEVDRLYKTWAIWWTLFGPGPRGEERRRAMGVASKMFFEHARYEMLRGAALDIGRLCGDPTESKVKGGTRENLTLERMVNQAVFESRQGVRQLIEAKLARAKEGANAPEVVSLRNRVLAHADQDTMTGVDSPDPVTIKRIRETVILIVECRYALEALATSAVIDVGTGKGIRIPPAVTNAIEQEGNRFLEFLARPLPLSSASQGALDCNSG